MPHVTWDKDAYVKLIAAVLASHPEFRPNFARIAVKMGEGSTYDSIQSRFRGPQKMAKDMKDDTPNESFSNPSSAQTTPRKQRKSRTDGVASGRVSKKNSPKKAGSFTLSALDRDLMGTSYDYSTGSSGAASEFGLGDLAGSCNNLESFESMAHVDFLEADYQEPVLMFGNSNSYEI